MNKWDYRMMDIAKVVSTWSKDVDHKVGAVLTTLDNRILSTGFNGYPKNIDEATDKLHCTIHAEMNALVRADFTFDQKKMYVTRFPCAQCAAVMIQANVCELITRPVEPESHWFDSMNNALQMFQTAKVLIKYLP